MKIKNDYIRIKVGTKEIELHNTILDKYIENLIENELWDGARNDLKMSLVYLRFDTSLEFTESSVLDLSNFDICFPYDSYSPNIGSNQIVINYNYTNLSSRFKFYDINTQEQLSSMTGYEDRKITAIGFGEETMTDIYACVDTSNYNLYTGTLDTILSITRRDIMSTDAVFYSTSNIVKGPIHLCDRITSANSTNISDEYIGVLKSIGLGITSSIMNQEISVQPYSEHINVEGNTIYINDEFTIEFENDGLFPETNLYPGTNVFPARIINNAIYPSRDLYPGIDQYMIEPPYQYMQLKYEIYRINIDLEIIEDTNTYYLLSIPIGNKNKIKMNINYERA